MKKVFRLVFLIMITSSLFYQCDDGNKVIEIDAIRKIVNETDYQVDIMVNGDIDTLRYSIAPNSYIDIEGKCYIADGDEYCDVGWMELAYGSITFDNERIQRSEISSVIYYTERAINSSVYNPLGYTLIEKTPDLEVYQYTITQNDYDTAEIL